MAILTISREIGSGADEVGMTVAGLLGYSYVDREGLLRRAQHYGLFEDRLSRLAEEPPSWFESFDAETRVYIVALQAVLYECAQDDDVVLMGCDGQWLLRGVPHALRTRLIAPFSMRMARLTEVLSAQGKERVAPKTVAHLISRADIQKAARVRFLFDVDFRDPTLYDVLINTAAVSREAAAKLLVDAARRPEFATTETARRLVLDRVVASQVEFALASHPDLRPHRIDVESSRGMVRASR